MPFISDLSAENPEAAQEGSGRVSASAARPLQVTWEMTRECEWKAPSARSTVRLRQDRPQVSTAEAFHLIEEIAEMHVPLLALSGGDPLLRPDLLPIIEFAARRSVRTSLTLMPTPKLDSDVISELKASGLMRVGFWLHGSTPAVHDAYWGVSGTQRHTLDLVGVCNEVQLPVQINTIISRRNLHDIDPMLELLTRLDVAWWNVFFFVPATPDQTSEMLTAEEHEQIFAELYAASMRVAFQIKTTEGQHYQRYLLQQRARELRTRLSESVIRGLPRRVNDNRAFVFIDHRGDVYPSRFLPLSAGNVMNDSLGRMYRDSSLFVSLRDPSKLKGKCGRCPVRKVCGGSRARAYAVTGDLFATEPCCAYQP
jgi:radical SAM protein with 4Fe4S-binding SPASM domain